MLRRMKYQMAAFDIDGTLIGQSRSVPDSAVEAIKRLANKGVKVAVATSRPYHVALRQFEEMGVQAEALTSAGADVRLSDGSVVEQHPMAPDTAAAVADICDRANWEATIAADDCFIRRVHEAPSWVARAPKSMRVVQSFAGNLPEKMLAVITGAEDNDEHLLELEAMSDDIRVDRALSFDGSTLFTVTRRGVDKGRAVRALCGALEIAPESVVAFGDSEVDLPMFEVSGLSVCMGNGTDEAKAAADMVTTDVDEDGIAKAIGEIWG